METTTCTLMEQSLIWLKDQAKAILMAKQRRLKVEQALIQASPDALNEAAIAEANTLVTGLLELDLEKCSEVNDPVLQSVKDPPMNYWVWITLVQNAIADLDLSASEELDLQFRCLWKESTEQVRRIKKTGIIRNPPTGLYIVWKQLGGIYCSP